MQLRRKNEGAALLSEEQTVEAGSRPPLDRPISHRLFLKLVAAASVVGIGQLASTRSVEATYIPNAGGDTVDTNLTVQGNLTVSGNLMAGTRKIADSGGCYYAD